MALDDKLKNSFYAMTLNRLKNSFYAMAEIKGCRHTLEPATSDM